MPIEVMTEAHYKFGKTLTAAVAAELTSLWRQVDRNNVLGSWASLLPVATATVAAAQVAAAADSEAYAKVSLSVQGVDYTGPALDPEGFAGLDSEGFPLAESFASPAYTALAGIGASYSTDRAMGVGLNQLLLRGQTQVADASRTAESVMIASRDTTVGWVRMLNPPSCKDCAILAGKWFRWNQGFQRHPGCDCRHIPSAEQGAGDLTTDPYEYFNSLSEDEKTRLFGKGNAAAIDDGADIYQVVNATQKKSMNAAGTRTTAGTTRGNAAALNGRGAARLTPQEIYRRNGNNRTAAVADLTRNGYILPGGQQAGGVLRGTREGFGALGRGGTRVGARNAVLEARRTGVRDPMSRYTMTAAERRAFDALNPVGNRRGVSFAQRD